MTENLLFLNHLNVVCSVSSPQTPLTLTAAPSCLLGVEHTGSSEVQRSQSAEP